MKHLLTYFALFVAVTAMAGPVNVTKIRYSGPVSIKTPYMVDSTDVNNRKFDPASLLDRNVSFALADEASYVETSSVVTSGEGYALNVAKFSLENERYATAALKVEGLKHYKVYMDGKEVHGGNLVLEPQTHQVYVKFLSVPDSKDTLRISYEPSAEGLVTLREDGKRVFDMTDVLYGKRIAGASLSPDGRYLITNYATTMHKGATSTYTTVRNLKSGKVVAQTKDHISWMPTSSKYYFMRQDIDGRNIVTVDPATGEEEIFAENVPEGYFQIAPTEDYLLYMMSQEGPKEREGIYQVLVPDDRQPGWRNRSYIAKYDLATGLMQPLTFGYNNVWAMDMSEDGKTLLIATSKARLEKRPTTVMSLHTLDLNTLTLNTLIKEDGYVNSAVFSPEGDQLLIAASPEGLGGIGKNVKEGQTPSLVDVQLYIMNIADGSVRAMTKDFNPNVSDYVWSSYDNKIYIQAEDKDMVSLFRMDPVSGKIENLGAKEELVERMDVAADAPVMVYSGEGALNTDRLYVMDTKSGKTTLLDDMNVEALEDVQLGECIAWDFVNSQGDVINGRYYLPPHFDPSKKYPMVVNYYGGCSPTGRNFATRYPHHVYASLGYVVYVLNPSGATGFGQEFSARHVNTAGRGPAEDIIEGTKKFCEEHDFVNPEKIGCIGASYGGFMTMYLQTVTDIFASAISHAGISDHTSYWGEGYWGYSYSEVSMANSYPWSHQDLYVKQSPLYNAEKVNTPILFLHGDSDVNVPVGESIQMFTALKLLGKETEMVLVRDQDHHILDYDKRIIWQNTIFAWFAKYLQDDPTWWDAIYAPKSL